VFVIDGSTAQLDNFLALVLGGEKE
jgi:hypothetical protein